MSFFSINLFLARSQLTPDAQLDQNGKNPPKIRLKIMKLTEYTYGWNSLTKFEFEAHAKTEKGNRVHIFF